MIAAELDGLDGLAHHGTELVRTDEQLLAAVPDEPGHELPGRALLIGEPGRDDEMLLGSKSIGERQRDQTRTRSKHGSSF